MDFWISGFQLGFLDFWISQWISGFQLGFLDFTVDFWISVWISADGVRDFFRDGPLGVPIKQRKATVTLYNLHVLTGVIYSVTTVPLTSGRISLGNFETTKYREENCYFVVKISLIYSNGSTKPAIKYQALVSSSFPRLNHLH